MIFNNSLSQRYIFFHSVQFIIILAQFYYFSSYINFLVYTREHREKHCQIDGLQRQKGLPSDLFPSIKFSGINSCCMLS